MGNETLTLKPKNRGGRPKGFTLTKTDYAVLEKIAELGFQTYRQLREGVLADKHRVAIWLRMKRLVRAGLLRESRDDNGRILAWAITKKGAGCIYVNPDAVWNSFKRTPIYRSSFEHDSILINVRGILSQSPAIKQWETESTLRTELMRKVHGFHPEDQREKIVAVPDAILHLEANGKSAKAAIELELTRKAKRRLEKKFEAHITSSKFHYILYIVKDESLMGHLMKIYRQVQENSVQVKIARARNGIYFTTLQSLLTNKLQTKFEGTQGSFCFANLT